MGIPRKYARKIDEEEMFMLYYVEGLSAPQLEKKMWNERGIKVSNSAIWQAARRYLYRNYKDPKIKQIVSDYWAKYGLFLSDEEYRDVVSRHARTCMHDIQYKNWIVLPENSELPDISED